MPLCYKAWLESRVRFLLSAAVLAAYCGSFVGQARLNFPPVFEPRLPYTVFIWRGIYNGMDVPLFVAVALLLGLGGLPRERAGGTAGFTLALPVTRIALLRSRTAVALLEVAALAVVPLLIVPWMSTRIGHPYPAADAARFAMLFAAAGAVWVSAGVLWSVFVAGELTGAVACVATPVVYATIVGMTALRRRPSASLFNVMNGARLDWLDPRTSLFVRFPWTAVLALALLALGLLAAAAAVTARDDF